MSSLDGTRPPSDEGEESAEVIRLPDRRRAVAESPELDAAISELLSLARFVKVRRFRGPVSTEESQRLMSAVDRATGSFTSAVRRALDLP